MSDMQYDGDGFDPVFQQAVKPESTLQYEYEDDSRESAFADIRAERARQDHACEDPVNRLNGWRKFNEKDSTDLYKLAILMEEVGEVGTEILQGNEDGADLTKELIQVAAVAVAWIEALRQADWKENSDYS